jgi:hypothetical protein
MSDQSLRSVQQTLDKYEQMEKDFDSKMQDATIKAKARLEAERLYTEELKENHGKPKSYFIAPTLSSSRRGSRRNET